MVSREDLPVKAESRPDIWMVRHGPTEWSEAGRHTSRTDVPLTGPGRAAAAALAPLLAGHDFGLVLSSPAVRARDTARRAGFEGAEIDADLREWDYGDCEGLTTDEIRGRGAEWAHWTVWTGPLPGGESIDHVAERAERIITRAESSAGDVLIFGHGHQLRILTALALDLDPSAGARFALDAATLSIVGHEHEIRALRAWNRRASGA
jgi:probable phosphoglycerate mutase